MTTKELIEKLSEFSDDAQVYVFVEGLGDCFPLSGEISSNPFSEPVIYLKND